MLVYRRVQIWVRLKILDTLRPSVLTILALNIGVLSMSWDGVPDFETVPYKSGLNSSTMTVGCFAVSPHEEGNVNKEMWYRDTNIDLSPAKMA
jgi:hypothetical protein